MGFLREARKLGERIEREWDEHVDPWIDRLADVAPQIEALLIELGLARFAPWIELLADGVRAAQRIAPLLGLHGEGKLDLAGAYIVGKVAPDAAGAAADFADARRAVQALVDAARAS